MVISARKHSTQGALMGRRDRLIGLSHAIHARPELAFEEIFASELLAHAGDVAVRRRVPGSGPPRVREPPSRGERGRCDDGRAGLLRQQLRSSDQVHGVVHSSGDAANVIPAVSAAAYCIRSDTLDHLERLQSRVVACFDAGALATGCDVDVTPAGPAYAEFRHDAALGAIYRANAEGLGRRFADRPGGRAARGLGSTDMGNVSHRVRSIHPMIGIGSLPAVNHQPAFADAAVSPAADDAILDGALALAWTVLDIVTPPPEAA